MFSRECRPGIVSDQSRLHGVAIGCRLGGVSWGSGISGSGGGRSRVACRRVAVTWVGLLGGHWSGGAGGGGSSGGGQHELLACSHKHDDTQKTNELRVTGYFCLER